MKWVGIAIGLIVFVAVGTWWYEIHSAETALLKQPVYAVLKKYEPEVYDKLVNEYRVLEREETRRENFINTASYEISLAATRHIAHASQSALLNLINDMLLTARVLAKQPDDSCFRYWFPQISGPPDVAKHISLEAQAHTLDLMAEVIVSASENPVPLPTAESVKDNLANVINATYEQYGAAAQMLSNADNPNVDRTKVCIITISVYDRIMKMPPEQSSALLRAMTQVH